MTTTPADIMTKKIAPIIDLHMEGHITIEELNKIMLRIIEKYEVKPNA